MLPTAPDTGRLRAAISASMENPNGRVRSLISESDGDRAIVEVDVTVACPRCAAGKGCGAGILGGSGRIRQIEVTVRPELGLCEGDQVEIALPSRDLLHAAAIVYGLPMLGAMFAAGLAFAMSLGDSAAAFWALGGLAVGLLAARWRLRQAACIGRFAPSVEKRLHELTAAD